MCFLLQVIATRLLHFTCSYIVSYCIFIAFQTFYCANIILFCAYLVKLFALISLQLPLRLFNSTAVYTNQCKISSIFARYQSCLFMHSHSHLLQLSAGVARYVSSCVGLPLSLYILHDNTPFSCTGSQAISLCLLLLPYWLYCILCYAVFGIVCIISLNFQQGLPESDANKQTNLFVTQGNVCVINSFLLGFICYGLTKQHSETFPSMISQLRRWLDSEDAYGNTERHKKLGYS